MTALYIDGIRVTRKVATELLALAPESPAITSTDDALAAIHAVLTAHGCDLTACLADLAFQYGEHMAETAARITRCQPMAAGLVGTVSP